MDAFITEVLGTRVVSDGYSVTRQLTASNYTCMSMNIGMLGQGRGSWAVSRDIIMIQLLKSIRIKDINYPHGFSTYVRETSL